MRIDAITIFPEYFTPLRLSLLGKAIEKRLIDVQIHDLRAFTEDRHRSVDDIPYGGGPGMVMKPEPWGRAIDSLLSDDQGEQSSTLIFLNPAGRVFTQELAQTLTLRDRLIFACGRYEGIDARVPEYYSSQGVVGASGVDVLQVSIGDYVVAGGEVAALVMIEAITRLVPGVIGNESSLVIESFADPGDPTAVEGPSYTRPEQWRGLSVPEVLRAGDHAAIARWRKEQAARARIERTG